MKSGLRKLIPAVIVTRYRNYKKHKKIIYYKGDKVECPVCQSKFKEFAPGGSGKRKNARCLNCGSLERHRLLWKYLSVKTDLLNSPRKIKLLHFAPEKAFYELFSQNLNIEYFPCDLSPERFGYAAKIKISKADITSIPFEKNYFDVVLCNHVLEHIPDDNLAMKELYRVMKNGGWGIFQSPIDYKRNCTYEDFTIVTPEDREKAFGLSDHVRIYGLDYVNRLEAVGFIVHVDDFVNSFSADELFKFGLHASELIYFCRK